MSCCLGISRGKGLAGVTKFLNLAMHLLEGYCKLSKDQKRNIKHFVQRAMCVIKCPYQLFWTHSLCVSYELYPCGILICCGITEVLSVLCSNPGLTTNFLKILLHSNQFQTPFYFLFSALPPIPQWSAWFQSAVALGFLDAVLPWVLFWLTFSPKQISKAETFNWVF